MKYIVPLIVLLVAFSPRVLAWSKHGHMASGSLAYKILTANATDAASLKVAKEIADLLEQHPFVKGPWKENLDSPVPTTVSRAERLFMLAAQWPDEVRSGKWQKQYHRADWHYVNFTSRPHQSFRESRLAGK